MRSTSSRWREACSEETGRRGDEPRSHPSRSSSQTPSFPSDDGVGRTLIGFVNLAGNQGPVPHGLKVYLGPAQPRSARPDKTGYAGRLTRHYLPLRHDSGISTSRHLTPFLTYTLLPP